jgi:hypothetical protein
MPVSVLEATVMGSDFSFERFLSSKKFSMKVRNEVTGVNFV